MTPHRYVYSFIDGAFFEGVCRHYERLSDCMIYDHLNWNLFGSRRFRTIYYDALPVRKRSESEEVFSEKLSEKRANLNRIRSASDCYVREGITRLREKGGLEQKGVDTWIAADAVRVALQGPADVLEVWTSDADLFPVFEVLRDSPCRSRLRYMEGHTIDELIYSAGSATPIRFLDILSEFEPKTLANFGVDKLPIDNYASDYLIKRSGLVDVTELTINNRIWRVLKSNDSYWSFMSEHEGRLEVFRSGHPLGILEQLYDGVCVHGISSDLELIMKK